MPESYEVNAGVEPYVVGGAIMLLLLLLLLLLPLYVGKLFVVTDCGGKNVADGLLLLLLEALLFTLSYEVVEYDGGGASYEGGGVKLFDFVLTLLLL